MMRNCISLISIFTLFMLGAPALNWAQSQGQEIKVFDGDTFSVSGEVIRLWGIDAPEHKQPCWRGSVEYACGVEARSYLQSLIDPATLTCEIKPRAKKETRTVALCRVKGKDLAQMMVRAGWALDYRQFSQGAYAPDEAEARTNKRGLWAGEFQSPRDWRRRSQSR